MLSHYDVIARDRARLISTISSLVVPGQRYALIDFPDYGNVGDSLIWLGTINVLTEVLGRPPSYVCQWDYDQNKMADAIGDGPIFLQGGGNFGDIYPALQDQKIKIIAENPYREIVQMPQSIQFRSRANASETRSVLRGHGNVRILVRDNRSREFCIDTLNIDATLTPDAAFGLGAIERTSRFPSRAVALMRNDDEIVPRDMSLLKFVYAEPVDWLDDEERFDLRSKLISRGKAIWTGNISPQARRLITFKTRASMRMKRGIDILTGGGAVITDRLHAHILSTLLGITNVCLDNDYGKIHSYIDAFTGDCGLTRKAYTVREAVEKIRSSPLPLAA